MSASPSGWRSLLRPSSSNKDLAQQAGLEMTQQAVAQQDGTSIPSADAGFGQLGGKTPPAMPVPIHQQNTAGQGTVQHTRYDSAELPSALGTPPRAAGCLSGGQDSTEVAAAHAGSSGPPPQQQQQLQLQDSAAAVAPQTHRVNWQLHAAPASDSCPPAGLAASSSTPQAAQQDGRPPGILRQDQAGCSREALPPVGRAGRSASLPASDDPQLDSYLRYLLKEQHPHSQLYYPGWGLTENGCAAIGEFLRRDRRIKVVTLSGNSINDEGMALIASGLASNGTLLSLDVSDNHVSSVGAIDLAEALHSDKCKVAQLLLHNNRIGDDGADALAAAVAASSSLKKLNLAGNAISAAQLDVVLHVLKTREYRLSAPRAASAGKRHLRKDSSVLQFDIELMEGQPRNSSSNGPLSRRSLLRLPTALAVAALVEAKDPLESSIGMQAAHLLAELQEKARQNGQPQTSSSVSADAADAVPADAAGPGTGSSAAEPSLAVLLGLRLACRGYDVVLRTCFPSLDSSGQQELGGEGKQQAAADLMAVGLRHTFVRVSQPVPAEEAVVLPTVIVDPLFRDQFEMPHPTARLQEALEALPRVLCLAEARLFHLVDLLCSETATAFKHAKLSLPPWRHTPAVMDKWLSTNYHDVVVEADSLPQSLEHAIRAAAASAPNP